MGAGTAPEKHGPMRHPVFLSQDRESSRLRFRYLFVPAGSLMAARIMHCLAVKLCAASRWMLATCWQRPVVALAKIEAMIDVSVEMIRPVKPRSRPDEYTP